MDQQTVAISDLPQRLAQVRRAAGLSQRYVADRLKISRAAISLYEQGHDYPPSLTLGVAAVLLSAAGPIMTALLGVRDLRDVALHLGLVPEAGSVTEPTAQAAVSE